MIVVPRLLIRNPAIPSQRRIVPSLGRTPLRRTAASVGPWLVGSVASFLPRRRGVGCPMVAPFVVHLNADRLPALKILNRANGGDGARKPDVGKAVHQGGYHGSLGVAHL